MRTRTQGIQLLGTGERRVDKHYRGERVFERLGTVSQDEAEAWLRRRQAAIDARHDIEARQGADQLFRAAAGKYLLELKAASDVRTLEGICGHVLLLNQWVGNVPLQRVCNDTFETFKADRLAGRTHDGASARQVKPATVNRSLEVARTVLNRAARVWRTQDGQPWIGAAPLIEMLDEATTQRKPYPLSWAQQAELLPRLPAHLQHMALFALNTGARDENVCGLRWQWEVPVPEAGRSVFVVPASEFKSKRPHVLILNDLAWRIVEAQRGKHKEFVFVYRRERVVHLDRKPAMHYRRVETMNNTAFQAARADAGLPQVRVHDLRHTFAQRLREAGVSEEDRALLLGHAVEGMARHYASSTVERLVQEANRVHETPDRTTLLRVVEQASAPAEAGAVPLRRGTVSARARFENRASGSVEPVSEFPQKSTGTWTENTDVRPAPCHRNQIPSAPRSSAEAGRGRDRRRHQEEHDLLADEGGEVPQERAGHCPLRRLAGEPGAAVGAGTDRAGRRAAAGGAAALMSVQGRSRGRRQ